MGVELESKIGVQSDDIRRNMCCEQSDILSDNLSRRAWPLEACRVRYCMLACGIFVLI